MPNTSSETVLAIDTTDRVRTLTLNRPQAHDQLLPAARKVAASIVGNNQRAVRALLESYHRIDEQHTGAGLWIEAASATAWMKVASGDDIAASRAAVFERGRAQVTSAPTPTDEPSPPTKA